jgi:beta-ketoacyl synthase-like protein
MSANLPPVSITGIGSVSPYGPVEGLIQQAPIEPTTITAWTTAHERRAFLVPPFRPATVVPGLKTRRLDRLSAWALVASSMALKDAGVDLNLVDRSRVAVVFATAFGCVELTEAFYLSAAANGWNGTDPITFPETLASAPASHVSMFHGLRGPNITVSNKYFGGESAMLQAACLLRQGQADLAIVLAGDALSRSLYSWYEEAGLLSPACFSSQPRSEAGGFIPAEGMAAVVLEPPARINPRPNAHSYGRIRTGRWVAGGQSAEIIRKMLGASIPNLTICSGNGTPCAVSPTATLAREIVGDKLPIIPPHVFAQGLAGSGAIFHLMMALASHRVSGPALFLGTARNNGFAALLLDLP